MYVVQDSGSSSSSDVGWAAGFSPVTKANEHRWSIRTGTMLLWPHQDGSYLSTWKQLCGFQQPSFSSASMVLEPPSKVYVTNIYILQPCLQHLALSCPIVGIQSVCAGRKDGWVNERAEARKGGRATSITKMSPILHTFFYPHLLQCDFSGPHMKRWFFLPSPLTHFLFREKKSAAHCQR